MFIFYLVKSERVYLRGLPMGEPTRGRVGAAYPPRVPGMVGRATPPARGLVAATAGGARVAP